MNRARAVSSAFALLFAVAESPRAFAAPEDEPVDPDSPHAQVAPEDGPVDPDPPRARERPGSRPAEPEPPGLRRLRGFLLLAPGIVMGEIGDIDTPRPLYLWGIDGGVHVPAGRRFAAQIGAYFDHAIAPVQTLFDARIIDHYFGLGPQLRLGGGDERFFGYALIRLGPLINYSIYHSEIRNSRHHVTDFLFSPGVGVQGFVAHRLLIGAEFSPDLVFRPDSRSDVVIPLYLMMRARIYIGIAF